MKILVIAPHPFFQERGTPIAVRLLIETLCEFGNKVDVLTYHEGTNLEINGLRVHRIFHQPFINNIPIGFSWKKIGADIYLCIALLWLLIRNKYDVIHAVEESIFPAVIFNFFFRKKLIFDMDSSMADQLIERNESLKKYQKFLDRFEGYAVRKADIVIPVCKYLAEKAKSYDPNKKVLVLEDIAFEGEKIQHEENIREKYNLKGVLALYVGNLEHYQGIDLLLESVARINSSVPYSVVIIGGNERDILKYKEVSKKLFIENNVNFIGPRKLMELPYYLGQADILLSPRIKGKNTPMKLYSYLASGKPVLATRIYSHLQAIDDKTSKLADPTPEEFAKGLLELIEDENLRNYVGEAGRILAINSYSLDSYRNKLRNIYNQQELTNKQSKKFPATPLFKLKHRIISFLKIFHI